MLLTDWAKRRQKELDALPGKRGVYAELVCKTQLNQRTVAKAARDGIPVSYEVAEKLSAATAGESSIDEIRFPERFQSKRAG